MNIIDFLIMRAKFPNLGGVGGGGGIVQPLSITENGTYTAPAGVDGYNPITVAVDPTKITILKEQRFSGFVFNEEFGVYASDFITPAPFTLNSGETYYVVWDGTEYECVAFTFDFSGMAMTAIGNGSQMGLPGNGEPFLIAHNTTADGINLFSLDAAESHTAGIWQKVSGGSSADVRYVTFKNYDGTVEYGKKAVAVGDDCADPIARGVFTKPSREPDAQYSYTFYGWATTPNGAADSNWNKAVTEDRTVYANFSAAVRYYTITYYDSDGTTVLKTESLAYGAMPSTSYIPKKDGFAFIGWTPQLATVTGNASYTAAWNSVITFANASWEQIAELSEKGELQDNFSLNDTRTLVLTNTDGTTLNVPVKIAAFSHDDLADDSGKAGITIICDKIITAFSVGTMPNQYRYTAHPVRAKLNSGDIYAMLPDDLKSVIKPVKKVQTIGRITDGTGGSGTLQTATESVWLLSCAEVGLTSNEGVTQYPIFTDDASRIRYLLANGNVQKWYLRTGDTTYAGSMKAVSATGSLDYGLLSDSSNNRQVLFGFCI